ncbi:MAG: translation initiation factor IF-2 [Saprospiraceae bacterium]|nr:translation initiation factor IF-2 [Saprospiraceae bacterium]MBK8079346.1 translation initiation factor IF-2 [Saprospiraceae bacterium]MBK8371756.1 translation initiation factor IF-2 [Saprospiraceae bacterium]MBK8547021.1 translation initiation factor IF-2 [Saprospiraceae bacterium]MBK8853391.1 translation initiation factor IF-2 [Saprospiraceae bacterium]
MAERLVKIAKELNVGLGTIVDFLNSKGFAIENKPTSLVSDEMHDALLKEFSSSMAEKEKADQIIIGRMYSKEEQKPEAPKPLFSIPKLSDLGKPAEPEVPAEPETPAEEIFSPQKPELNKLKVVGKIDLDKPKPKKEEKKEVIEKPEPAPTKKEVKEEVPVVVEKTIIEVPEVQPEEELLLRAETPQLKGLKIMGKIDTSKLDNSSKPKKVEKPQQPSASPVKQTESSGSETDAANKKKRKRKKLPTPVNSNNNTQSGGQQSKGKPAPREEVKEVSQKEIDDKIKATMAKLTQTGKNKRQKVRRDNREVKREKQELRNTEEGDGKLKLTEFVSVSELASLLDVPVTQVITTCMNLGVIVSINQRLDAEIIELVAGEFGHDVEFISAEEEVDDDVVFEDDPEDLEPRAPIVTVMGHVDHGKTSLLDFIRSANVAGGEAGGITQHIGAYEVKIGPENKKITFLDTPGHEAFTAMRARGAKVTDIAVVIVAADDKIMPQTKEAISHAQAAGVPIIFAINKIDKDGADPERIKGELAQMNLLVEDWGGTYQSQDISAKKGLNIDKLLEKILLEAEILDLKANPNKKAQGTVIEASLDKGRGYVTKILVHSGTLEVGDPIVAGPYSGKVKAMFNEFGVKKKKAGPSTPTLILGLSGAPQAGEKVKVMDSEQEARQIATKRAQIEREQSNRANKRISLDEIGRRLALGTFKELNLIVKGDVDGSIEALADSLIKLSVETIQVNVIHKAVGQIVESDVLLASASDAIIIGFQVRPSNSARILAEREGVQIKMYSVIYEAIEEVKSAMEGMLEPTREEKILGQIDVRETYKMSKVGTIAGCYVTEGKVTRNNHIRVIRDGIVIFPTKEGAHGEISSLKRYKEDVKEVKNGMECGITIKNFNDIVEGDNIEVYEIIEIKQTLE